MFGKKKERKKGRIFFTFLLTYPIFFNQVTVNITPLMKSLPDLANNNLTTDQFLNSFFVLFKNCLFSV